MTGTPDRLQVVVVAGAGKTTGADRLAATRGLPFLDAHELHPPENVARMRSDISLGDCADERGITIDNLPHVDGVVDTIMRALRRTETRK